MIADSRSAMAENPPGVPPSRPLRVLAGRLPRGARFGLSGSAVALVNLGAMTLLVEGFDVGAQIALVVSYVLGLLAHFTLNRQWVFSPDDAYHLHLTVQGVRYFCSAAAIYGLTALSLATLPGALDVASLAVYYVVVIALSVVNFFILRSFVFRAAQ
jgi:putative flippase GtrA